MGGHGTMIMMMTQVTSMLTLPVPPGGQLLRAGPLLGRLTVPPGHRVVEELVDAVDDVGAHQGEAPEAAAVHHADGERRAVQLLRRGVWKTA